MKKAFKPLYKITNEAKFTFDKGYPELEKPLNTDKFYLVFDYTKDRLRDSSSVVEFVLNITTGFWMVSKICYGQFPDKLGKFTIVGYEDDSVEEIKDKVDSFLKYVPVMGPYASESNAIYIAKRLDGRGGE